MEENKGGDGDGEGEGEDDRRGLLCALYPEHSLADALDEGDGVASV